MIGGYGGNGTHTRRADVLVYAPTNTGLHGLTQDSGLIEHRTWRVAAMHGKPPSPRMGHAAVLLGDYAVLVGGRTSPCKPLSDVWALHLPSMTWSHIATQPHGTGQPQLAPSSSTAAGTENGVTASARPHWPGRYRHTAVADPAVRRGGLSGACRNVVVFGGSCEEGVLGDLWVLQAPCDDSGQPDPAAPWEWVLAGSSDGSSGNSGEGELPGTCPSPRKSHAAAALGGRMYVHGGAAGYGHHLSDMWSLDLDGLHAQVVASSDNCAACAEGSRGSGCPSLWALVQCSPAPPARFSHTLTAWGQHRMVLAGGYPTSDNGTVYVYDEVGCPCACAWTCLPPQCPEATHP